MNTNEIFKTNDINLTTFLCVKGLKVDAIENHSARKTFIFQTTPQLIELVELFNFAEKDNSKVLVDAREILKTFREVKTKLFTILP